MYNSSNVKHDEKSKNIVKEDSPYFGVGNMKMYIEKQALFYSKLKRTKFTILRHSNIYGPHDKFDENSAHVLPNFLNKALNEKKIFSIWGNGKSVRDFLYIGDLINCIKIIIAKQKSNYEIFNVGSNNPITILQLAKIILKVVKRKKIIKYVNKSFSIDNKIKISNKKINSLNWRPKYSLELGVRKTINWLKASNK
jgi:nucleoside-diphosphate-sugar epimerase